MMAISWTNAKRKLSDLIPWEHNPRQLTETQAKHLTESIRKFGQVIPYSISPKNEIYDGHQRQHIMGMMDTYGKDAEVDVRISDRQLTEEEHKELVIRLHENVGEWDFEQLANIYDIEDLEEWGFDERLLEHLDFGEDGQLDDPGAQMDKAEELREKWGVKSEQLWQLGEHRVICGDCTETELVARLMMRKKADLLWTDPPYHVGKVYNGGYAEGIEWDGEFQVKWQMVASRFMTEGNQRYICFAVSQLSNVIIDYKPNRVLIWCKPFALMRANAWDWAFEMIAWCYDGERPEYFEKPNGIGSFDWQNIPSVIHGQEGKHHITQKPIALPSLHVEASCPKNGIVYDSFLGSGTTLIACERLKRKCRGVEIEPKYVAVTLERWSEMTKQTPELIDG